MAKKFSYPPPPTPKGAVPPSPTGRVEYKATAMPSKRPGGGTLGRKTLTVKRSGKRGE